MEFDSCKDIVATIFEYQPWLIALAGALFTLLSVYIGHWLTIRTHSKRADALERGLDNEVHLIKNYFQGWLKQLVDEFENPLRPSYSGFSQVDMSCIDSLVVELIAVNRILTKDQRGLILNLKTKISGIPKKDHQRDEATTWYEQKGSANVPTPCTARLIIDAVEVISYLNSIDSGKKFSLENDVQWEDHAMLAFSKAGIEYKQEVWERVMVHGPENS
ncbi:hypothetical protein Q4530_07360 [Colwellia sp. 1_MG-2023]|uniref:hypothetical protein n=1 Tax=unclassified Colwellia TaxID=196834 RepID=UPI001C09399E|nr:MULTISPECIES: hypothetical protein [unclassified Colwellia]MBU2926447.1 hypothetical protein [Colwellia sp. C2M11]MDO6652485.1 hypothetical protein [Colwellia sp. 3_MG-2023]MDO6665086.1 hypothetical protein [Colwellia sp. 2_MG-2023]MDO6689592.1 hypothetical protein [Colwellia sp. 1_MG-2023]